MFVYIKSHRCTSVLHLQQISARSFRESRNDDDNDDDCDYVDEFYGDVFVKSFSSVDPFHTTGLFLLYLLTTSENQRFSDVFKGYRKRPVA